MAEIALDRVSKRFPDGTLAVHEVSFTIRDGEFFILVGPSGCGKSTLLNMIVGLETPSAGEIRLDGQVIDHLDPKDRNMAMVFQSYALYPHMTVRQNLAFPLKMAKVPRDEMARRVEAAAATLELTDLLDRKPRSLSGGQRQRVAMGRALVRQPAAFLLDEPLSNLDARLRTQMRTDLARLQRRLGTTTVYVTHDQGEAMTLGDRVAVLRRGQVQQVGPPQALYHRPRNLFVARFIGSPSMNALPAVVQGGRLRLPMGDCDLPEWLDRRLAPEGARLIAAIRPEHFRQGRAETASSSSLAFRTVVDVVEWMGADLYAHFGLEAPPQDGLNALPEDIGVPSGGRLRAVARLDAAARVAEGEETELTLEAAHLHLFDAETGESLRPPDPDL
jgi:multiple sugar transport system ATP-binding protein